MKEERKKRSELGEKTYLYTNGPRRRLMILTRLNPRIWPAQTEVILDEPVPAQLQAQLEPAHRPAGLGDIGGSSCTVFAPRVIGVLSC